MSRPIVHPTFIRPAVAVVQPAILPQSRKKVVVVASLDLVPALERSRIAKIVGAAILCLVVVGIFCLYNMHKAGNLDMPVYKTPNAANLENAPAIVVSQAEKVEDVARPAASLPISIVAPVTTGRPAPTAPILIEVRTCKRRSPDGSPTSGSPKLPIRRTLPSETELNQRDINFNIARAKDQVGGLATLQPGEMATACLALMSRDDEAVEQMFVFKAKGEFETQIDGICRQAESSNKKAVFFRFKPAGAEVAKHYVLFNKEGIRTEAMERANHQIYDFASRKFIAYADFFAHV